MAAAGRIALADILKKYGPAYLAGHTLCATQAKAWRAIVCCRTDALGGHIQQCTTCNTVRYTYHSCRNRHCPKCQTRAKEQWVQARNRELLPVPYTHLVFTLPHVINGLAGGHFRSIIDILFKAAADTLIAFGADPKWLGGQLAFSLVLHTWSQNLMRHVHVHALVASGALNQEGHWINSKRGFLFPVKALSKVFREKFIDALKEVRQDGRLHHAQTDDAHSWNKLLMALRRHDWVVYAKQPLGGPAQVLEYLSRYTHRVAISNERIMGMQQDQVAFRVRDNANPGKKRIECLPAEVFIGRFLLHALPNGFKRIRHYGLLAPCHKQAKLAACRQALATPDPDEAVMESAQAFMQRVAAIDIGKCPCCEAGRMEVVGVILPRRERCQSTGPPP
jgi:hypothetical protein